MTRLGVLFAAVAAVLFAPASASAASCGAGFGGGDKSGWEVAESEGTFEDAALPDLRDLFDGLRDDAFDGYAPAVVDGTPYATSDLDACDRGMGGQELTFPADTIGDLKVTPALYVDPRRPFGRQVVTLKNTGDSPATIDLMFNGEVGSDSATRIYRSSDGNKKAQASDAWAVSCEDGADDGCVKNQHEQDPELANNWERPGAKGDSADQVVLDDTDHFEVLFENVRIRAGKSASFMHIVTMARTAKSAHDAAVRAGENPKGYGALKGLSRAERKRLRNW